MEIAPRPLLVNIADRDPSRRCGRLGFYRLSASGSILADRNDACHGPNGQKRQTEQGGDGLKWHGRKKRAWVESYRQSWRSLPSSSSATPCRLEVRAGGHCDATIRRSEPRPDVLRDPPELTSAIWRSYRLSEIRPPYVSGQACQRWAVIYPRSPSVLKISSQPVSPFGRSRWDRRHKRYIKWPHTHCRTALFMLWYTSFGPANRHNVTVKPIRGIGPSYAAPRR